MAKSADRPVFWAVRWGETIRLTTNKHDEPVKACVDCYGMSAPEMLLKNLGSAMTPIRTSSWLQPKLNSVDGWEQLNPNYVRMMDVSDLPKMIYDYYEKSERSYTPTKIRKKYKEITVEFLDGMVHQWTWQSGTRDKDKEVWKLTQELPPTHPNDARPDEDVTQTVIEVPISATLLIPQLNTGWTSDFREVKDRRLNSDEHPMLVWVKTKSEHKYLAQFSHTLGIWFPLKEMHGPNHCDPIPDEEVVAWRPVEAPEG
jgi:hypothetical protein